jgi:hypothetical protein
MSYATKALLFALFVPSLIYPQQKDHDTLLAQARRAVRICTIGRTPNRYLLKLKVYIPNVETRETHCMLASAGFTMKQLSLESYEF